MSSDTKTRSKSLVLHSQYWPTLKGWNSGSCVDASYTILHGNNLSDTSYLYISVWARNGLFSMQSGPARSGSDSHGQVQSPDRSSESKPGRIGKVQISWNRPNLNNSKVWTRQDRPRVQTSQDQPSSVSSRTNHVQARQELMAKCGASRQRPPCTDQMGPDRSSHVSGPNKDKQSPD
jgi:hypothetical protein